MYSVEIRGEANKCAKSGLRYGDKLIDTSVDGCVVLLVNGMIDERDRWTEDEGKISRQISTT